MPSGVGLSGDPAAASGKGRVHRGVRSSPAPAVLPPVLRDSAFSEGDRGPRDQERGPLRHGDGCGGHSGGCFLEVRKITTAVSLCYVRTRVTGV